MFAHKQKAEQISLPEKSDSSLCSVADLNEFLFAFFLNYDCSNFCHLIIRKMNLTISGRDKGKRNEKLNRNLNNTKPVIKHSMLVSTQLIQIN